MQILHVATLAFYCNLSKIRPPLKISPTSFLNEVVAKSAFHSKVCPPIYAAVRAVVLSKKHQRSHTVQGEGLTNEGRPFCCYCVSKRMTKEALQNHAYIVRARLIACEVGIFSRETS